MFNDINKHWHISTNCLMNPSKCKRVKKCSRAILLGKKDLELWEAEGGNQMWRHDDIMNGNKFSFKKTIEIAAITRL